ncbi:hypothetical protein Hypma_008623 [Hypsizygus marmoreus]|uniref:Uncharacterized protein n=1 Tax=Hypsizygus marmoreus TaxID=39966 RepID=A0A369JZV3_HYPMA|nr:hypothetical protein Hypma_008623 [Hypsizygus marmoreus]
MPFTPLLAPSILHPHRWFPTNIFVVTFTIVNDFCLVIWLSEGINTSHGRVHFFTNFSPPTQTLIAKSITTIKHLLPSMSQIHTLHRTGWLILLGFTLGVLYSKITSSYSPEDSRNSRDAQFPQEDGPSSHADRIGDAGDAAPTTSLEAVDPGDGYAPAETLPSTSDAEDNCETPMLQDFASPAPTSQASVLFAQDAGGPNDGGVGGHALTPVSDSQAAGLVINIPVAAIAPSVVDPDLVAPGAPRLAPAQLPMIPAQRTCGISSSFFYPHAGITIEENTSHRFKIRIASRNPDFNSLTDILKRHLPDRGLLSLNLTLYLMDSLDEMYYGREIMEKILVHTSPILHILYIDVPDMGKFRFDSQLTAKSLGNIAFPVLKSFTWTGRFEKTFFNPVLSLPTLPFHQLTTLKLNGILAVDDCIEVLRRCDSITRLVVDRLESIEAVFPMETLTLEEPKELTELHNLKLLASNSVDVRPLLQRLVLLNVTTVRLTLPSYEAMSSFVRRIPWTKVHKVRLIGPAGENIRSDIKEACRRRTGPLLSYKYSVYDM